MTRVSSQVEWRLKRLWYGCGIAMLLMVAIVSLVPVPVSAEMTNDKLGHVILYFFLSGWFSLIVPRPGLLWRVFLLLIAYGALMELLQGMTAYRSLEFADGIANSVGVGIGLLVHFSPLRGLLIRLDARLDGLKR